LHLRRKPDDRSVLRDGWWGGEAGMGNSAGTLSVEGHWVVGGPYVAEGEKARQKEGGARREEDLFPSGNASGEYGASGTGACAKDKKSRPGKGEKKVGRDIKRKRMSIPIAKRKSKGRDLKNRLVRMGREGRLRPRRRGIAGDDEVKSRRLRPDLSGKS